MKKPDLVHHLLRLSTDHSLAVFEYWKALFGTERVFPFVGEPAASNQLISPRQFEQFAFPYIKELHEKLLGMGYRHIYCHICGEANANRLTDVNCREPIMGYPDQKSLQCKIRRA